MNYATLLSCRECGVLVSDQEVHTRWHEWYHQAIADEMERLLSVPPEGRSLVNVDPDGDWNSPEDQAYDTPPTEPIPPPPGVTEELAQFETVEGPTLRERAIERSKALGCGAAVVAICLLVGVFFVILCLAVAFSL